MAKKNEIGITIAIIPRVISKKIIINGIEQIKIIKNKNINIG